MQIRALALKEMAENSRDRVKQLLNWRMGLLHPCRPAHNQETALSFHNTQITPGDAARAFGKAGEKRVVLSCLPLPHGDAPVDPRLRALGELGEGKLSQVQVLLWVQHSALDQLLPDERNGEKEPRPRFIPHLEKHRRGTPVYPALRETDRRGTPVYPTFK